MAENKEQKTQLLTDTPPEVQAALDRQKSAAPSAGQSTMLLDTAAPGMVTPRAPAAAPTPAPAPRPAAAPQRAAAPPRASSGGPSAARWAIGPIIAIVIGGGTFALAGKLLPPPAPPPPPPKVMGKLQVKTTPSGASVTVDGKPFPHFTPTALDAEVGSTVSLGFKLDGYQPKEMDVAIAAGEHPLDVTLDKLKEVAPPVVPPPTTPVATPATDATAKHDHEHHSGSSTKAPPKETGTGTLSVSVRPWAIVFVDEKKLKQTPVQAFPLPAGKHLIELVNDGKGKHERIPIVIKPNDAQEIRRDWDQ